MKRPHEILIDRIVATWLVPAAQARGGRVQLERALVIWRGAADPDVLFNDELSAEVRELVLSRDANNSVTGLRGVRFQPSYYSTLPRPPYIVLVVGAAQRAFVLFHDLDFLAENTEFLACAEAMREEGGTILEGPTKISSYIDFTANLHIGSPAQKRRQTQQEKALRVEAARRDALSQIRRHRKLPVLSTAFDESVTSLLRETREAYIAGLYFSAIASAATLADRICLYLAEQYCLPAQIRHTLRHKATLGVKVEMLVRHNLLDDDAAATVRHINDIRNKYLHPKQHLSRRAEARDAGRMMTQIHRFVDYGVGHLRRYEIAQGRLVPRRLVRR